MKYSEEIVEKIIKFVENGATNKEAAMLADVSEETFYCWQRKKLANGEPNPDYQSELSELLKKAKTKRKVAMVNRILTAAQKTWQAAAWYLERKHNEEFGRREKHEVEFSPQDEIKKMDERIKSRWPEKEDSTKTSPPDTSEMPADNPTA